VQQLQLQQLQLQLQAFEFDAKRESGRVTATAGLTTRLTKLSEQLLAE
jgi:hypothetical protein